MGSMSNSNPWSPYDSYNDCSQGICNIYCPQWCYLIFPPPPPVFLDDSSSSKLSPLLIALIGILASAFVLVSYYTLISKYCHRRCDNSSSEAPGFFSSSAMESGQGTSNVTTSGDGLSDSLIKSIKVYKYRKGDGFVDGSDCSVCLSEFEENESLRLLPKCSHAFHLPCIDTWLKSHSNCPLCRAFVTGALPNTVETDLVVANYSNSVHQTAAGSASRGGETEQINSNLNGYQQQTGDLNPSVVIEGLEIESRNSNGRSEEQREIKDENPQQIQRSVSLNSGTVISIADVIREIKDEEESGGVGTSQLQEEDGHGDQKTPSTTGAQRSSGGVSSFLVRSSASMKRSVSTGRFMFSKNYRLPN